MVRKLIAAAGIALALNGFAHASDVMVENASKDYVCTYDDKHKWLRYDHGKDHDYLPLESVYTVLSTIHHIYCSPDKTLIIGDNGAAKVPGGKEVVDKGSTVICKRRSQGVCMVNMDLVSFDGKVLFSATHHDAFVVLTDRGHLSLYVPTTKGFAMGDLNLKKIFSEEEWRDFVSLVKTVRLAKEIEGFYTVIIEFTSGLTGKYDLPDPSKSKR